jgi:hypothetical protein
MPLLGRDFARTRAWGSGRLVADEAETERDEKKCKKCAREAAEKHDTGLLCVAVGRRHWNLRYPTLETLSGRYRSQLGREHERLR